MSHKIKLTLSAITTALLTPMVSLAACPGPLSKICELADSAASLAGTTLPRLFFAMALAYFLYGVFSYVSTGADAKKREEARGTIVYGIIILFVMSSVWGLVQFLRDSTNIQEGSAPSAPTVR
ncbi:MAG: hypothetical protein Q7S19_00025 [bacterium]|nr:hypothetical protein [bacterium]